MSGDVDLVVVGISNSIARPIHILIFNKGLTLLRHEYNVTAERWRDMILDAIHYRQDYGMAQQTYVASLGVLQLIGYRSQSAENHVGMFDRLVSKKADLKLMTHLRGLA